MQSEQSQKKTQQRLKPADQYDKSAQKDKKQQKPNQNDEVLSQGSYMIHSQFDMQQNQRKQSIQSKDFANRFQGKTSLVGKQGHIGIVKSSRQPIQKIDLSNNLKQSAPFKNTAQCYDETDNNINSKPQVLRTPPRQNLTLRSDEDNFASNMNQMNINQGSYQTPIQNQHKQLDTNLPQMVYPNSTIRKQGAMASLKYKPLEISDPLDNDGLQHDQQNSQQLNTLQGEDMRRQLSQQYGGSIIKKPKSIGNQHHHLQQISLLQTNNKNMPIDRSWEVTSSTNNLLSRQMDKSQTAQLQFLRQPRYSFEHQKQQNFNQNDMVMVRTPERPIAQQQMFSSMQQKHFINQANFQQDPNSNRSNSSFYSNFSTIQRMPLDQAYQNINSSVMFNQNANLMSNNKTRNEIYTLSAGTKHSFQQRMANHKQILSKNTNTFFVERDNQSSIPSRQLSGLITSANTSNFSGNGFIPPIPSTTVANQPLTSHRFQSNQPRLLVPSGGSSYFKRFSQNSPLVNSFQNMTIQQQQQIPLQQNILMTSRPGELSPSSQYNNQAIYQSSGSDRNTNQNLNGSNHETFFDLAAKQQQLILINQANQVIRRATQQ